MTKVNKLAAGGLAAIMLFSFYGCKGKQENIQDKSAITENCMVIGVDESEERIDSINVVSVNSNEKKLSVLSIPEDIQFVKEKYSGKITDSNIEDIMNELSSETKINIQKYIVLDFDAVLSVLSEMGNVSFEIPDIYGDGQGMVYDDNSQNLHISLTPGMQELTPEEMLDVIRYIKGNISEDGTYQTYSDGEIGRIAMQQSLIKALLEQKRDKYSSSVMLDILKELPDSLKTNLDAGDIINGYNLFKNLDKDNVDFNIMEGEFVSENNVKYFRH